MIRTDALRRALEWPRDERLMFYALLSAQLRAGLVPGKACAALEALDGLPKATRRVAKAGAQAEREGVAVVAGLSSTGLLPPVEAGVLRAAESMNRLPETLADLAGPGRRDDSRGLLAAAVGPNLYYIVIASVLVAFVLAADGFFESLGIAGTGNPLAAMSAAFRRWLPPGVAAFAALALAAAHGSSAWTGPARRLLGPLDALARLRFSIRFCDLAEMMSRHGAANTVILETAADVWRDSGYLSHHARRALDRVVGQGAAWETALSGGLLPPDHADLLRGLAPGASRRMYPEAFRTLAEIQRQLLRRRLRSAETGLRLVLLGTVVWLFSVLIEGLYSIAGGTAGSGFL